MARSAEDLAHQLILIYGQRKKRYVLTKEQFKTIAGKENLKEAYLYDVDDCLREDGYTLIDLREEREAIAVIKIRTMMDKWEHIPDNLIEQYRFEDSEEENGED